MTGMHLAHARTFDDTVATWHNAPPLHAMAAGPGSYGARSGPNLPAILLIVALHAAALAALILLDVIPVGPVRRAPTVIELIPDMAPPPPLAAAPPPPEAPPQPAAAAMPVVSPPPIVRTAVAAAPIIATPAPAPVIAQAAPAAPAPATPVIAAAIVPPDGSAASLHNPAPRYPIESRRRREEGIVRLRVVITPEGRVRDIAVARSSGYDRLDDAALDTVRRWRFRPGTLAGAAVEAIGFINIPFQIRA